MNPIRHTPWIRHLAICTLLFSVLSISGCNGCRGGGDDQAKTEEEIAAEKKKEKKKPDFETHTPVLLPGWFPKESKKEKKNLDVDQLYQDDLDESAEPDIAAVMAQLRDASQRFNRAKLGHWVEANFQAIANNYNADGQLTCYSMDAAGRPVAIPSTDYYLTSSRPVSLPKGEWKNFETGLFLPRRSIKTSAATVNYSVDRNAGGIPQILLGQPTILLKPFQYHVVLLSDRPDTFNFLKLTDSFQMRGQQMGNADAVPPFYYLVPTIVDDPLPIPRHSLNWTTIAYLIWDDFDPDKLSIDHQAALLDWLHFGGQLILSGPDCLDKLQNSFLGNYLPAQFDGSRNITNRDLDELNENWTVPVAKNEAEKRTFQISDTVPLLGVSFKPHDAAQFVSGTGELAIERSVGRGRILLTAFSLNAPVVRKWRSFPSFVNNVLLRRPARRFGRTPDIDVSFGWEDDKTTIFDPLIGSTLRYLSRDLSQNGTPENPSYSFEEEFRTKSNAADFNMQYSDREMLNSLQIKRASNNITTRRSDDSWHFGGYADAPQSGVGGWNDDSGISLAARETLKEAAGITPPSSKFVLKMLAAYLLVLVPLNWVIFRLLGRVEWAWIAAPFIAIIGAVMVVKMASLDIGFVRSNTQIGLLEIHADYSRAHATEYSALYTSLSTRYDVDLDNATAQSLPFARVDEQQFLQTAETLSEVKLKRTVKNRLEGFPIQSNSTGLLHTEFMLDLEGTLYGNFDETGKPTVVNNGTVLNLENAGVVTRDAAGKYSVGWIGNLVAGSASNDLKFETHTAESFGGVWRTNPLFVSSQRKSDTLWNEHIGKEKRTAALEDVKEIPEVAANWGSFGPLLIRSSQNSPPDTVEVNGSGDEAHNANGEISRENFSSVLSSINNASHIRIGRLFDTVVNNLSLAPGESRLLATTEQRLGRTKFDPEATQTDQQTLIVLHLKRPPLPVATRDLNAYSDFTGRSDLDWQKDELEGLFGE